MIPLSDILAIPFSTAAGADVRVRFCPSPTGTPHVGLIRTALFNWAYARHTGGTFVFRIEDTDAGRDSEESYEQILDGLNWLGIDWDEGVAKGGPHGPYRQSQRSDIYRGIIDRLVEAGLAYESFSSAEEIDARNVTAGRPKEQGYDNYDRGLTDEQKAAFRAEGRLPAIRLRVPDADVTFDDLIRGEITFPAGSFSDFVIVRPNGQPLYTLVNPVDDALMGITHVLRGEDIMPSTARQIPLYLALIQLGVTSFVPRFGHMPSVLGEGNKKLSKRDPQSNLFHHRDRGFIPEGLDNYLALLGWGYSADRDVFSLAEMVEKFDIVDVNPNPARFDQKKAESINGDHIRLLDVDDFAARCVPYLVGAGVFGVGEGVSSALTEAQFELLRRVAPLVQPRVQLLGEVPGMVAFLFTEAAQLVYEGDAVAPLGEVGAVLPVLDAAAEALRALASGGGDVVAGDLDAVASGAGSESAGAEANVSTNGSVPQQTGWNTAAIEACLREALIDGLGLKPRVAFGPVRVAISGRRVSPPLFESLELLGPVETFARLARLRQHLAPAT